MIEQRPATSVAFAHIAQSLGSIDALLNVAGGFQWQTIGGEEIDAWDQMYAMNLKTAVLASHVALPYLIRSRQGRIVNVAAMAALSAGPGMGAYAASKAGLIKMTESLAAELFDAGINVNAVLPSTIDTPRNRCDMPDVDRRHWVNPVDLARVIGFFLTADSRAITGASLPVTRASHSTVALAAPLQI